MGTSEKSGQSKALLKYGCFAVLLFFTLLSLGLAILFYPRNKEPERPQFIKNAEPEIEKKEEDLRRFFPEGVKDKNAYDIDQTVMAIFSIEKAFEECKNFEELTAFILQKESGLVAPDVARLKYRFFDVYKKMLESKDRVEELNSIYKITTGTITDLAGAVGFDGFSGVIVDREQAKRVWEKRLEEAGKYEKIKNRLEKQQDKMLDLLFDFVTTTEKYTKEWDELCGARDRAYLAFYERDWNEVVNCAQKAVSMSPHEKEAHILLALALIERRNETDMSGAKVIIGEIFKEHQAQQAPAYLLRGVTELYSKNYDSAIIDFDQAAAYYPKQQEEVTDRLNLYRKRRFLNNSREGRVIINTYRGIMSGSGYFSPDFQKARIHMDKGEKEKAKQKIFDHFFRRRLQGQWDKVLTDFQFCRNYLETSLYEITANEDIDLSMEPSWLTNSVVVSVNNRSSKDIHNVTILLCVRFTDMFKGDYISFPVGDSIALLPAKSSINVGRQNINDVTKDNIGTVKKWKDIIEYGAVLISDEIITWVPPSPKIETKEQGKENSVEKPDNGNDTKEILKNVINSVMDSVGQKK